MRCTLLSGLLVVGLLSALALPLAAADFTQPDVYAVGVGISQDRDTLLTGLWGKADREQARETRQRSQQGIRVAQAPVGEALRQAGPELTPEDRAPMVLVPAGEFLMGSTSADHDAHAHEKPAHNVSLDAYYIDRYEVTTSHYAKFLQATGREPPTYWQATTPVRFKDRPVVGVNWDDAAAYCQWVGGRLPTEAEWEKSARGTDGRKYPWGNSAPTRLDANFGDIGQRGFTALSGYAALANVGKLEGQSPYGAYDMAGNVWEWTSDWYDAQYYSHSPSRNPAGPSDGTLKVLRGGSWFNGPQALRATNRSGADPQKTRQSDNIGFRCARTPPEAEGGQALSNQGPARAEPAPSPSPQEGPWKAPSCGPRSPDDPRLPMGRGPIVYPGPIECV